VGPKLFAASAAPIVTAGMLGVTVFGLVFTPAFYTLIRKAGSKKAWFDE
jgi:multidrug efflux pump subunit AcrB